MLYEPFSYFNWKKCWCINSYMKLTKWRCIFIICSNWNAVTIYTNFILIVWIICNTHPLESWYVFIFLSTWIIVISDIEICRCTCPSCIISMCCWVVFIFPVFVSTLYSHLPHTKSSSIVCVMEVSIISIKWTIFLVCKLCYSFINWTCSVPFLFCIYNVKNLILFVYFIVYTIILIEKITRYSQPTCTRCWFEINLFIYIICKYFSF